jgi:hypothetical protein
LSTLTGAQPPLLQRLQEAEDARAELLAGQARALSQLQAAAAAFETEQAGGMAALVNGPDMLEGDWADLCARLCRAAKQRPAPLHVVLASAASGLSELVGSARNPDLNASSQPSTHQDGPALGQENEDDIFG